MEIQRAAIATGFGTRRCCTYVFKKGADGLFLSVRSVDGVIPRAQHHPLYTDIRTAVACLNRQCPYSVSHNCLAALKAYKSRNPSASTPPPQHYVQGEGGENSSSSNPNHFPESFEPAFRKPGADPREPKGGSPPKFFNGAWC